MPVLALLAALALTRQQGYVHVPLSTLKLTPVVTPNMDMDIIQPSDGSFVNSPLDKRTFKIARVGRYRLSHEGGMSAKIVVAIDDGDLDPQADTICRIAMRCWEQANMVLGMDVPLTVDGQKIVIFLSDSGTAGGQEMISSVIPTPTGLPMSAVYINQVKTLTDRLECLREVSHECGHSFFPAIGGFSAPENWSNGDMGERIMPAMLLQSMLAGGIQPDDLGGVTLPELQTYNRAFYEKSVDAIAYGGPSRLLEQSKDEPGFDYAVNLICFAYAILPRSLFVRSASLGGGGNSEGFTQGMEEALLERDHVVLSLPKRFVGRAIWVPLRARAMRGGKPLAYHGHWSKVLVANSVIELVR